MTVAEIIFMVLLGTVGVVLVVAAHLLSRRGAT